MLELLFSDSNFWFSIALVTVAVLFIIELISLVFGISLTGILDTACSMPAKTHSFQYIAHRLCLDQVPVLIWLIIFLTLFGALGFIANLTTQALFQFTASTWITIVFACIVSVIITANLSHLVAKLLSKFHTQQIDDDDFIGAVAHITIGCASKGVPAEARFTKGVSRAYYVLVEPSDSGETFKQGECVILIAKKKHYWLATRYQ